MQLSDQGYEFASMVLNKFTSKKSNESEMT